MSRKKGSKNKSKKVKLKGRPKKTETKPKELIKIKLKSLGRIYESEGATFEEAIGKIKISNGARISSVLTINGKEKLLNGRQTNGLFGQGSPTMKAIHLHGVKQILGV